MSKEWQDGLGQVMPIAGINGDLTKTLWGSLVMNATRKQMGKT